MSEQPPAPPPSEPSAPAPLTAEQLAEKLQRERFEAMMDDPTKLAEAQERLAREAIAHMRRDHEDGGEQAGLRPPLGAMVLSGVMAIAAYEALRRSSSSATENSAVEIGIYAFSPLLMVLVFVFGGLIVGRASRWPVLHAALTGALAGVGIVVAQRVAGVPATPGQAIWVLAAVAFFALGALPAVRRT